jgi:hypothetical protein
VWTLNRGASEFPKEIGFNPAWVTPPTADGQPAASSGGRGRRGSSGGGGNRAPGSPFSTHQESYEDARRVQLLTGEVRNPPARLTIVDTPSAVTMTNELGQSRTVHPDSKEETVEIQGVLYGVTSRRDGDQLIVVYRVEQARQVQYTFARADNPLRLVVDVQFLERGAGDKARRVYDAGLGSEVRLTTSDAPPAAGSSSPPPPAPASGLKTPENLDLLTLHTFVDSLGTSDKLWNDFKETLLWTLHQKTLEVLTGGTEFIRAEEKQRELRMLEVRSLAPRSFSDEEIQAHFTELPARYGQIHSAREILADLALAHRFIHLQLAEDSNALEPIVTWHNEPDRGYTEVKICTWNRAGLFSKIAGSLTAAGLNILSAQIFSRNDGIILDTFYVNDARTGKVANREEREKLERVLQSALTGEVDFPSLLARQKVSLPLYQSLEGQRIPTLIQFDNSVSESLTVIDVEALVQPVETNCIGPAGTDWDFRWPKLSTSVRVPADSANTLRLRKILGAGEKANVRELPLAESK